VAEPVATQPREDAVVENEAGRFVYGALVPTMARPGSDRGGYFSSLM
jgi:hypothetical protein